MKGRLCWLSGFSTGAVIVALQRGHAFDAVVAGGLAVLLLVMARRP